MKKLIVVSILFFGIALASQAQDYNTGLGVRGGLSYGFTIKHFVSSKVALEGIVVSRWRGVNLTGLLEFHNNIGNVEGFNWYWGLGGHVGFWDGKHVGWAHDDKKYTVVGVDGIIGLEYNFKIPLNISVDWKPAMNLSGYSGFWGDEGAVSVRYIF